MIIRILATVGLLTLAGCSSQEPFFVSVLSPTDTFDTLGPYVVEAYVGSTEGIDTVSMVLVTDTAVTSTLPMLRVEGDSREGKWAGELPGRPVGTQYEFFLRAVDEDAREVLYPEGAPDMRLSFSVLGSVP